MKKILFLLILITAFISKATAQENHGYKIVFQLVTSDTTAHKGFMKQLSNILEEAPDTKIQVVCHGPGISMLRDDQSIVLGKIQQFMKKGVDFTACENTLKGRNIPKEKIMQGATFTKAGIIEIVDKQSKGWAYIKAGS